MSLAQLAFTGHTHGFIGLTTPMDTKRSGVVVLSAKGAARLSPTNSRGIATEAMNRLYVGFIVTGEGNYPPETDRVELRKSLQAMLHVHVMRCLFNSVDPIQQYEIVETIWLTTVESAN